MVAGKEAAAAAAVTLAWPRLLVELGFRLMAGPGEETPVLKAVLVSVEDAVELAELTAVLLAVVLAV